MNPNYSIILCFVEKNPKQHLIYVLSPIESLVFYHKYLQLFLLFSKNFMSPPLLLPPILQNSNLLNYSKSHHHDQTNMNSKFKRTKFPDQSLS